MKKIISMVCIVAIVLSLGIAAFAAKDSRGDVNADGEITLTDGMAIVNYCAKKADVVDFADALAGDVDQDYEITLNDAMWIINLVAKKVTAFPEFDVNFDYGKLADNLGIRK